MPIHEWFGRKMEQIPPIKPCKATSETIPSRMLRLADAYAEAAQVLCKALAEDDFQRRFDSIQVILHLCRHAAELFMKGAIAHKTGRNPKNIHRLDWLYAEYKRQYPSNDFEIDFPFPKEVLNSETGLFPELMDEYMKTHDQRFRYPADTAGRLFSEHLTFEVVQHQAAIDRFRSNLNWIVARIEFNWK